jgi:hypothetical protein
MSTEAVGRQPYVWMVLLRREATPLAVKRDATNGELCTKISLTSVGILVGLHAGLEPSDLLVVWLYGDVLVELPLVSSDQRLAESTAGAGAIVQRRRAAAAAARLPRRRRRRTDEAAVPTATQRDVGRGRPITELGGTT